MASPTSESKKWPAPLTYVRESPTRTKPQPAFGEGKEAQRCLKQARRLAQITDRLKRKAANFPNNKNHSGLRPRTTQDSNNIQRIYRAMNRDSVKKIIENIKHTNNDERDLADYLIRHDYNDTIAIATLTKHTQRYHELDRIASKREVQYSAQITWRRYVDATTGPTAVKHALTHTTSTSSHRTTTRQNRTQGRARWHLRLPPTRTRRHCRQSLGHHLRR